ncbi:DNA topoisomerase (ATP-hydrolyzing) subunit B [Fusobacterium perfoetens]|uniref:DNA topoisomerase (ATP-hydrolyzing) subunit B n=1 Tax=Fusobacterium perfoetens TaxID=852 RepID=UPI00056C93B7|nr:DNA topoisomerase (ATP-hydrolyzing) subunit B [Fusobacterium perfoetens]MCI6151583.1 DNA topoisomerase (ATP-hydrolyzing) subunit B [Fusobacterium perfoetens]MDY3237751.1 DNA topoisomerase (ATP-hydrolyzing) subunit B [Fusobacterium perfoetens]
MSNYQAENITVLEGLEAVRKRPGMYIGTTSERGLHHLVWEIVDNSIDEALAGYCNKIIVNVLPNNIIEVIDNGRGIPTGTHPKYGKSALEIVLTVLHAGGKFENDNYKVSGGLHGVGVSVVNALSEWLEVEVKRDGKIWFQRYDRGKPEEDVKIIGEASETGTKVTFKADGEIFETLVYSYETLETRLKELAYLNKGLRIELNDMRKEPVKSAELEFQGGIIDYIKDVEKDSIKLIKEPIYMSGESDGVIFEAVMLYNTNQRETIYSFVNNIHTHEGGTHVSGYKVALTRVINDLGKAMGYLKDKDGKLQGSDIREGLTAIVSVKIPQPQFEGQTKTKLGNSEVTGVVSSIVGNQLKMYLEDNPSDMKVIIDKVLSSKKAREAAQKARELVLRKSALEVGSLPGKLADCSSKNPEECEIYIVEGDSAGGSAKQGRDRRFQAILPLRGKILNVEKAGLHKALENSEIRSMITAFGTGIGDNFDISKLRYGKIVIMTDADVDGAHIRTLLLTFFYRYLVDLLHDGHIYIAQPPLYKISSGKSIQYAYTDKQLKEIQIKMDGENKKYTLQRYKGLGEMNPEQLWETTMDPDVRTFYQVKVDDAREADLIFDKLMGDKVEPRREFIEAHAEFVKNLDI